MNFHLKRIKDISLGEDGIFGEMESDDGSTWFVTLEHAYLINGIWTPKVAVGTYTCKRRRSPHFGYDVFMLENVPDFQNEPVTFIELHIANWETQLQGCIGLGDAIAPSHQGKMIRNSKDAFTRFMKAQEGVDECTLIIS